MSLRQKMIVNEETRLVKKSSNFKSKKFTISATAESFRILSKDLYTNEIQAVIRELSTNANDSHVESGTSIPFYVHLPTYLEPFFSIRDYGTGLSQEDCETIYTGYFTSTKTHSNELNGCLGLGSKSPFAISESFTVISRFNGKKFTYLAFKDEDGIPDLSLLVSEDTNEANGLEVSVDATGKINNFDKEAIRIYRYFDNLPSINKEEITETLVELRNSYLIKNDNFAIKNKYGKLYALMGNVAYPIQQKNSNRFAGYIRFPIGSLRFEPGRERLIESDSNNEKIKTKLEEIKSITEKVITEQLSAKETAYDRALYAHEISHSALGRSFGFTLDDYKLPNCGTYFKIYNGYSEISSMEIPHGDDVEFYIDKERVKNRLKEHSKNGFRCVVLSYSQATECCVPHSMLKDPSELPKPIRDNRNGVAYRPEKIFQCKGKYFTYSSSCWGDVDYDEVVDETKYYVEISRWQPRFPCCGTYAYSKMTKFLSNQGIDVPIMYGVKSSEVNKKKFKKDATWKPFDLKIKELFIENIGSLIKYGHGPNYNLIKRIATFHNEGLFAEFSAIEELDDEIIPVCHSLGIYIESSDAIIDLENKILDKYTGIELWYLDWYIKESDVSNILRKFDV